MLILSVETSCDDTGVALLDIKNGQIKILADFVSSQIAIHAPFGGVVPNLAVRAHYKNLPILLEKALKNVDVKKINLVAATNGPGLEPCLWAGINTAKVLARALDKPMVGVNHLEGHVAANFFAAKSKIKKEQVRLWRQQKSKIKELKFIFPAVCLIVSGGHTQLVLMKDFNKYEILGQTRDDAAGEAFDKVAKMLGLKYPGGPEIALNAKNGDSKAFELPRPMIDSNDYDFSFSGLKTAVRYLLTPPNPPLSKGGRKEGVEKVLPIHLGEKLVFDICACFQQAAIDVLVDKTIRAGREYKAKTILLAGGVAANQELRKQMEKAIRKNLSSAICYQPSAKYCADNAAMIGLAGYWKYMRQGKGDNIEKIRAEANLNF